MKQTEIVWVSCGINHEGILVPGSTGVPANMSAWWEPVYRSQSQCSNANLI